MQMINLNTKRQNFYSYNFYFLIFNTKTRKQKFGKYEIILQTISKDVIEMILLDRRF